MADDPIEFGKCYILRKGEPDGRLAAVYGRCAIESYARAEMIVILEQMSSLEAYSGHWMLGYYDVDPRFTLAVFRDSFRKRKHLLWRVEETERAISADGWDYLEVPLQDRPGHPRQAFANMTVAVTKEWDELVKSIGS